MPQSTEQHLSTMRKNQKGKSPGFCSGFAVPIPESQSQQGLCGAPKQQVQLESHRGQTQKAAPCKGHRTESPKHRLSTPGHRDLCRATSSGQHRGSLTPSRPALQPLREALHTPSSSLTSTQVSISENWFMMGRMTSMELPTCRSDLFPTKIMGILGKTQSLSEATPLLVPALSQPLVLPWAGQGGPNPPPQGPEQLSCLPQLGASIWRNRLPDPAYTFTQQQYVQEPLIQPSSLLPK